MVKEFYCFYDRCYIGKLYFYPDSEKKFVAENQENYTIGASNFVKYMPLSNTSDIDAFISERVIPLERPDRSVWITMLDDCSPYASDEEIFIKNYGRGLNDLFWMNTEKSLEPLLSDAPLDS